MTAEPTSAVTEAQRILNSVFLPPSEAAFGEGDERVDFLPALDLERIGQELIRQCPEFSHLRGQVVIYLWKRKGGKHCGQLNIGKCTKPSGLLDYFAAVDWVVWLAADYVESLAPPRQYVEAAIYHELCHTAANEETGKPEQVDHDFTGFVSEVKRYGAWQANLRECKAAWQQAPLFERE